MPGPFYERAAVARREPRTTKAVPVLAQGDPTLLAQFIKKNGTHFVRSAVYGGTLQQNLNELTK